MCIAEALVTRADQCNAQEVSNSGGQLPSWQLHGCAQLLAGQLAAMQTVDGAHHEPLACFS
jgi:hypothetical protein